MSVMKRFALATALAIVAGGFALVPGSRVAAQEPLPNVLLVLDKDAIDYGPAPHFLPADAVNPAIAGVGVRDELSYFQGHLDAQVVLTGGKNGNDGWFAIRTAPDSWSTGESPTDGLENFAMAGAGLGSPDENGDRESLLDNVQNVTPVRAEGLELLVGRTVCAVVYSGDVSVSAGAPPSASLKGASLGIAAFTVVATIPTDDADRPNVQVQIAEGHKVCTGQLVPFSAAPDVVQ